MSTKWNLFVDLEKCTGCRNCFIAVKDEYVGNGEPGYFAPQPLAGATWFGVEHHERGAVPFTEVTYLPKTCRHCDDAPCAKAATGGAVEKRADGIVVIHPEKAKGQKAIADACPYGAALWNEDLQLAQAWPFDAHLLDGGWSRTRVEQACPTGALKSEKLSDADREAKRTREGWRPLPGEAATRPRVFYRGLERLERRLIAGSVSGNVGGRIECIEDARIELEIEGAERVVAQTDAFGDFRFTLAQSAERGLLRVLHPAFRTQEKAIDLVEGAVSSFDLEPVLSAGS